MKQSTIKCEISNIEQNSNKSSINYLINEIVRKMNIKNGETIQYDQILKSCSFYKDVNNENRYLLLFDLREDYINEIIPVIIYFRNENYEIFTYNKPIFSYDCRNSSPKIYFYCNTIIMVQRHRDIPHNLILNMALITNESNVYNTFNVYSNYICYQTDIENFQPSCLKTQNNYLIHETNDLLLVFDMLSLIYKNNNMEINITLLKSKDEMNILNTKYNIYPEIYNNYPFKCYNCDNFTMNASIILSHNNYSCTTISLGFGYCKDCKIRYSQSLQDWVCAQLNETSVCNNRLVNKVCEKHHLNDIEINKICESEDFFYPYKKKITFFMKK